MKLFTGLLLLISVGCSPSSSNLSPTIESVSGQYIGSYEKAIGMEYFDFYKDGTFSQKLVRDGNIIYDLKGKWGISKTGSHVYLRPFMPAIDIFTNKKYEGSLRDAIYANWQSNEQILVFSSDHGYWIHKQK